MKGLVLCGGQSMRMGKDKALLQHQGYYWAQLACHKLQALELEVVLSVNEQQVVAYNTLLPYPLLTDNNDIPVHGPLKGILSTHCQYPREDLFVLACDMPCMHTDVLQQLLASFTTHPSPVTLYAIDGRPEPLCGIYTAKSLQQLYQLANQHSLHKHSMQYALSTLNAVPARLPKEWEPYFTNMNQPEDLSSKTHW